MPDSNITKKALAGAMKQLMAQKPFAKISVGDICALCDMNRKSFYYHFKDKYDLVNWIYYTEFVGAVRDKDYSDGWDILTDICIYLERNRPFYCNALQVEGQNSFRDYFWEMLTPVVVVILSEIFESEKRADPFYTTFFADAFLAAIDRWLLKTPGLSAPEFTHLLRMGRDRGRKCSESFGNSDASVLQNCVFIFLSFVFCAVQFSLIYPRFCYCIHYIPCSFHFVQTNMRSRPRRSRRSTPRRKRFGRYTINLKVNLSKPSGNAALPVLRGPVMLPAPASARRSRLRR